MPDVQGIRVLRVNARPSMATVKVFDIIDWSTQNDLSLECPIIDGVDHRLRSTHAIMWSGPQNKE